MATTASVWTTTGGREARSACRSLILGLGASLCLSACGAGAPDFSGQSAAGQAAAPPASTPSLAITTAALPAGRPFQPYPSFTLTAAGPAASVTWDVISGELPEGLALTADGCITGTPREAGISTFAVRATSGALTAERTYGLAVGTFALVAIDGLLAGAAWTDVPVSVSCLGASGDVRFEVVTNGSGGALSDVSPATGTARWRPGATGGSNDGGTLDTLRAHDVATGASAELSFVVRADPTAGFQAEFGRSDVWFVDTTRKTGAHEYATDTHQALVEAGLRAPTSTDRLGTVADRLAETCVRVALLRNLNRFYLREANGSRGAGLQISFPWAEPVGATRPADGSWLPGGAQRYSVIGVVHGSNAGVVGTAFTDGATNGSHEADVTSPGTGELGVFANRFVETVNYAWNNLELVWHPVGAADVPSLEAILYGLPDPGGRTALLRNGIEAVGRSIAAVAAHEIGHSLGLGHTSPRVQGSIMNSAGVFAPDIDYAFTPEAIAHLRGALPGLGRSATAAKYGAATGPEGGIATCGDRERCNLVLEDSAVPPCDCAKHRRARSVHAR
jgi:hypothetical protein